MNATTPLAVLDLGPGSINLDVRPKLLARMFGVSSMTVTRSDEVEAFPVRRRFGTRGVGVSRNGTAPVYFWTTRPDEVLQALASADWPVSWGSVVSHTDRPYERSDLPIGVPRLLGTSAL
jgi:hypothetical protein